MKDRTGQIGCLRFNHLYPPFDKPGVRRVVLSAISQRDVITAVAGTEPTLMKTDIGLFSPDSPLASDAGVAITRGRQDFDRVSRELAAAGYQGERVVVLAALSLPSTFAAAQVATDVLRKVGMEIDFQALDWDAVVQRRASKEPIERGGWSIFYTFLGGLGNISPGPNFPLRADGLEAWFGWPTDPAMEALRDAWFEAADLAAQQTTCRQMQELFWQDPSYMPLGLFQHPTAFRSELRDIPDGWPQFYGVRRVS